MRGHGPFSIELCAGGGGQALGLEAAGLQHVALVEIDKPSCATLIANRPAWNVVSDDVASFDGRSFRGIELLAAGLPCPPFSVAGKQLGHRDERNLFPVALRLIDEIRPSAVMIENVRGILETSFDDYRSYIMGKLKKLGYWSDWRLLNASDWGVSQLRPRAVLVAVKRSMAETFSWPKPLADSPPPVGEVLYDLMASRRWKRAKAWQKTADKIAPTIVGGSHKHGGPDLGPTRARRAWAALGVDGLGIANEPPARDFVGMPKLTIPMVARLQGFPDSWQFVGRKTQAYRQVGNAFPPPVARAVGESIRTCVSLGARVFSFSVS
ncbi:MAG TPA: DNA (cytosine-5-)-methyltransferase [bacterium]|nr:DNA (cytosine-5-)-methyltransferase [bacterium]